MMSAEAILAITLVTYEIPEYEHQIRNRNTIAITLRPHSYYSKLLITDFLK